MTWRFFPTSRTDAFCSICSERSHCVSCDLALSPRSQKHLAENIWVFSSAPLLPGLKKVKKKKRTKGENIITQLQQQIWVHVYMDPQQGCSPGSLGHKSHVFFQIPSPQVQSHTFTLMFINYGHKFCERTVQYFQYVTGTYRQSLYVLTFCFYQKLFLYFWELWLVLRPAVKLFLCQFVVIFGLRFTWTLTFGLSSPGQSNLTSNLSLYLIIIIYTCIFVYMSIYLQIP